MSSAFTAEAGSVSLTWNANPEPDVVGYVVAWGTARGTFTGSLDVGLRTTVRVPNLRDGVRYYFAVRAYTAIQQGSLSAQVATVVGLDADRNGLSDAWETWYGLNTTSVATRSAGAMDSDGDGVPDSVEYQRGTHPRGTEVQYLPEGVQSRGFWETQIALLNPGTTSAKVVVVFERADGQLVTHPLELGSRSRATLSSAAFSDLEGIDFATRIESDTPLVVDRTVSWDSTAYGGHAETALPEPALRWYVTEGATSPFSLFYLIQNPDERAAQVRVTYLLESGEPVRRTYEVAPHSRKTIFVNGEGPRLAAVPVSGVIESLNDVPIIAERALYLDAAGRGWGAGSASAGVTAASPRWFFAEGAANTWFDLFYLFANPSDETITVRATYLLPGGGRVRRSYEIPPHRRRTVHLNADPRLANTAASATFESVDRKPFLAERSMWWPRGGWYESHTNGRVTAPGTRWAIADGESGGPRAKATYVLAANTDASDASIRITLVFEGGGEASRRLALAANSRATWDIGEAFPGAVGRRYGILVESLGDGTPIVVERATYWNGGSLPFGAGTSAAAVRLSP